MIMNYNNYDYELYDVCWLAFHTCLVLHFPPLHFGAALG